MQPFTYQYNDKTCKSFAEKYLVGALLSYRVELGEQSWFTIAPTENEHAWIQVSKLGEIIQPHDLVQAMGKGLHDAGITKGNSKE
jgi:hypothetical protein